MKVFYLLKYSISLEKMALNQLNIKKFTQKARKKVYFWLLNGPYYHFEVWHR